MGDAVRMIDANANRASEAARTMEDLARFVLDDAAIAEPCKRIRHRLAAALDGAGYTRTQRAVCRDTAGDVGKEISARDPHSRESVIDMASAAGGRLTEALRVIEEAVKLTNPASSAEIEAIRYEGYEAERSLLLRLARPGARWSVCVLVSESLCEHHAWLDVAEQAVRAGAGCVQLREKSLSDRDLLARAEAVVERVRPLGGCVMINDRPDIARLSDADGVHLGQNDLRIEHTREIIGDTKLIGVSCSSLGEAAEAVKAGADTLGIGAMYDTSTKLNPRVGGPALLREVLGHPGTRVLPHLAIGGIDADRAASLAAIGCRGVAVSSAVCGAADPGAATAAIVEAMGNSGTQKESDRS